MKFGSQKAFFAKIWSRLHDSRSDGVVIKAPPRKSSTTSSTLRKRKGDRNNDLGQASGVAMHRLGYPGMASNGMMMRQVGMSGPIGMGMGMGGHGPGRGHHGMMDHDAMAKRIEQRISKLIADIGGTPEQKDKLLALARATLADLKPLREQHMAARRQGMALLTAPTIDRGALEQLRVSQVQAADAMSQRTLKAMADAAEVLSPEQRSRVAERMTQRMSRRGHGG